MFKRILFLLLILCLIPLACLAEEVLSEDVVLQVLSKYPSYEAMSSLNCNNVHGFVSLHREEDGKNLLVHVKNGKIVFATDKAVPQGDPIFLWNNPSEDYDRNPAFGFQQYNNNSDLWKNVCLFQMDDNGIWRIRTYHTDVPEYLIIDMYADRLSYENANTDGAVHVYGVVETDLRYFNLSALPKTIKEAREKLSFPPDMPRGDMRAEIVEFAGGQKFDVYSCPDEHSYRAANGKARVSTNDWIQVFGIDGDYVLIQYDISSEQYRIGYITKKALPKKANVAELDFAVGATALCTADTNMTDDPLCGQGSVLSIPQGHVMRYLSSLGDFAYVETALEDGTPIRGFVPMDVLSVSQDMNTPEAVTELLPGTWETESGSLFIPEGMTFAEDNTYASVTAEKQAGTWHVQLFDAEDSLYGSTPAKAELVFTPNEGEPAAYAVSFADEDHMTLYAKTQEYAAEAQAQNLVRK